MKITAIKQQVKRSDRYSVYVDGAYAFSLSEGALLEQGLASGQEFPPERLRELKAASGTDKAYGNALRYVAMRPRSSWELRTYLRRKQIEDPIAEQIIGRLTQSGFVNDRTFAEAWIVNRRLLRNSSTRRLQLELKQKHVPEHIIDEVIRQDETDERTLLRQIVAKKRARYPDDQKLMQYLARQGFSYDDIKGVLSE